MSKIRGYLMKKRILFWRDIKKRCRLRETKTSSDAQILNVKRFLVLKNSRNQAKVKRLSCATTVRKRYVKNATCLIIQANVVSNQMKVSSGFGLQWAQEWKTVQCAHAVLRKILVAITCTVRDVKQIGVGSVIKSAMKLTMSQLESSLDAQACNS